MSPPRTPFPGEGKFAWLNPRVPEVQAAAAVQLARIAAGMAEDTPEEWRELEESLLFRFLLETTREPPRGRYYIHVGGAARPQWERFLAEIGCRAGMAPSDVDRHIFERQLAFMILEGRVTP